MYDYLWLFLCVIPILRPVGGEAWEALCRWNSLKHCCQIMEYWKLDPCYSVSKKWIIQRWLTGAHTAKSGNSILCFLIWYQTLIFPSCRYWGAREREPELGVPWRSFAGEVSHVSSLREASVWEWRTSICFLDKDWLPDTPPPFFFLSPGREGTGSLSPPPFLCDVLVSFSFHWLLSNYPLCTPLSRTA